MLRSVPIKRMDSAVHSQGRNGLGKALFDARLASYQIPAEVKAGFVPAKPTIVSWQLEAFFHGLLRHGPQVAVIHDVEIRDLLLERGGEKLEPVKEFPFLLRLPQADNLRKSLLSFEALNQDNVAFIIAEDFLEAFFPLRMISVSPGEVAQTTEA